MEHRWSLRTPIELDVDLIRESGSGHEAFKTRDIGLGGVFLEGDGAYPEKNTNVELNFILATEEGDMKHRIKARVVRIADDGVGLMFRDFDVGAFRSLQEVLRYKRPDSVH